MLSIAICDDEVYFLDSLKKTVSRFFSDMGMSISVSSFETGEALLSFNSRFDIVIMDIKLPGKNGMEIIRELRGRNENCRVIFTTAYDEYALQAFDVDAVHYLLKPVSYESMASALRRSIEHMEEKIAPAPLTVVKGTKVDIIPLDNILYCEALEHRIYIHTLNAVYDYVGTLEQLQSRLDERFFRCHKSFVVNMEQVTGSRSGSATVSGGGQVLVSRRKQREFAERLLGLVRSGFKQ